MGRILATQDIGKIRVAVEKDEISEEQAQYAIINGTPSLWMETYLCEPRSNGTRLKLRPCQIEVLQNAKTLGVRWGRQLGKEQPHSAQVLTPNGFTTMGEIQKGDQVITMDGTPATVTGTFEQGVKDVYRIEFTDGSWAECGLEHLWLCRTKKRYRDGNHRWRTLTLRDIIELGGNEPESDFAIRVPLTKPVVFKERPHVVSPYVMGVLLGDGGVTEKSSNIITTMDQEILERVAEELPEGHVLRDTGSDTSGRARSYRILSGTRGRRKGALESELERFDLKGKTSGYKFIPHEYLHDSIENRTAILRGLMDTDGYASPDGIYEFCTKSDKLAEDVIWLVHSLGGKIIRKKKTIKGNEYNYLHIKQLTMNPFHITRKAERFYQIKYFPTRTLKRITLQRQELSKCIMVDHPSHTYLTNDFIVTHNTTVLSGRLLWECATEEGITCGVYAPRKKHIKQIFDYIEEMTKLTPELREYVMDRKDDKKKAKSPDDSIPRIEFQNGSKILFFHTQSKVARELIRGTPVDRVYIEEAAFIDEESLGAIAGVITAAKNVTLWAQSNARNKSGWFYEFCNQAEIHSHHTSMESPDWNDEKEAVARMLAADASTFAREYLAEWTSDGMDAFTEGTMTIVENAAQSDSGELEYQKQHYYSSEQIRAMPGQLFLGVDWNISSNGVKFVSLKTLPGRQNGLIYQDVQSIEDPVYTQLTAVEKLFGYLIENKIKAFAIDKGYGAMQAETISRHLEKPEYAHLKDNIHIVDFNRVIFIPKDEIFIDRGTDLETIDEPYIKMSMKTFMVSVMTRKMLVGDIAVGPIDAKAERRTLLSELRSVKVEKVAASGYPVYTKKDLHKFSAMMLAVYAAFMYYGEYRIVEEDGKPVLRRTAGAGGPGLLEKLASPFAVRDGVKMMTGLTGTGTVSRRIDHQPRKPTMDNSDIQNEFNHKTTFINAQSPSRPGPSWGSIMSRGRSSRRIL